MYLTIAYSSVVNIFFRFLHFRNFALSLILTEVGSVVSRLTLVPFEQGAQKFSSNVF